MRGITPKVTVFPGDFEIDNSWQRVLVSIVLDFSGSMYKYTSFLPGSWEALINYFHDRPMERLAIELACCPFSTNVEFYDYAPTSFYTGKPMTFDKVGFTSLGTALLTVIESTRQRRRMLAAEGISSLRPISFVITDGGASDGPVFEKAIEEVRGCATEREIDFIPVTPKADCLELLAWIFGQEAIPFDALDFDDIFAAFGRSVSRYSMSEIGYEPSATSLLKTEVKREVKRIAQ